MKTSTTWCGGGRGYNLSQKSFDKVLRGIAAFKHGDLGVVSSSGWSEAVSCCKAGG